MRSFLVVKQRKKTVIVDTDEGPRAGTTAESFSVIKMLPGKRRWELLQLVTHQESTMVQQQS